MHLLITGSDGMVGSRLVNYMKDRGHTVSEFGDDKDIRSSSDWDTFKGERFDYIIHLAALAGVRASFDQPDLYYDVNVNGTARMLEFALANGLGNCPRILYASSSNAYEWHGNPYATTKMMNEIQCLNHKALGMRFHTIWPGRDDMLFKKLQRGDVTYINNQHYRDFVHVDDVIQSIDIIMDKWLDIDEKVLDIGTGHATPVSEVARVMGYEGKYVNENPSGERVHTKANIEPLLALGYTPKWNILDYENSPS